MKFSGETKFDIGSTVHIADFYDEFIPYKQQMIVRDVDIRIFHDKTFITYFVEYDGVTERVPEEWLFNTYEECTKWCKEQNGSL